VRIRTLRPSANALAAEAGAPTFTHARDMIELAPQTLIDDAEEIVRARRARPHAVVADPRPDRRADRQPIRSDPGRG
jgi:hypothetical protein